MKQRLRIHLRQKISKKCFFNNILLIDITIFLYIELLKCFTNFASIINLIPDILNFTVLLFIIQDTINSKIRIDKKISSIFALLFMVWVTITGLFPAGNFIVKYQRYRYIFLGFTVYYITAHYATKKNWIKLLHFLYISQIINTILATYQFTILHTRVDVTNGIFGFLEYNNAFHGLFCLVMSIIATEGFLTESMSKTRSIFILIMSCYTCALAEIKAFYVLFIMGALLIVIMNTKSKRILKLSLILSFIGIIGLSIALFVLLKIMPENLYAFMGMKQWSAYESYETGRAGGMGRMTQLQYIYSQVFHNQIFNAFIGKGLGFNVTTVPYELGKIFLNFGIIGLGIFILFLSTKAVELYKYRKKIPEAMVSMVMCILALPCMIVWNATLNRAAMILFVIIAIGSIQPSPNNEGV